ncbi:serine/threonine protein kinase [Myxococcota bacterium]|nr:serine/threonine protein kinase [Myxococcota bacterium]
MSGGEDETRKRPAGSDPSAWETARVVPRQRPTSAAQTPLMTDPMVEAQPFVERVSAPRKAPEDRGGQLGASDVADLLLWTLLRRSASGLRVEPDGYAHQLTLELGEASDVIGSIPAALGDAVVARLAIIAGLDIAAPEPRMARVKIKPTKRAATGDDAYHELLVVIEPTRRGLEAEVRRLMTRKDVHAEEATSDEPLSLFPDISGRSAAYRVLGEIGRGATGIVYRGEHAALGKPVAIKVLDARIANIPEQAARFAREGRAASKARHPGIVDVTDFGTLRDGRAFLVMELVEGRTLQSIIDELGALEPPRAIAIARQLAAALEAAHTSGIIHRDIKPANIFVTGADVVKLGDFGAAKMLEAVPRAPSDTQGKRLVGTPYYMAPEHALGESTDRRSDVYSLGCVLFTMLSGHVPFEGTKVPDVLAQHITAPVPQVDSPFGPLPLILRQIVTRSLAKRPEERYQSAAEMLADLDRAAQTMSRTDWRRWLPL